MGFPTYDSIIEALTVHGRGQSRPWMKTMGATGAIGRVHSSWRRAGLPTAGSDPSSLTARQVDASVAGALSFANPTGGRTLHLLRLAAGTSAGPHTLVLVDRLLDYGGIQHNSNAAQNLTNGVALPRYADGVGVMAFLEVTTALGASAQNLSMSYTDEDGNAGQASVAVAMRASAVADEVPHGPTGLWVPLAAGDRGVRSVESVQFSAANSAGVSTLVLCRPVIELPLQSAGLVVERDMVLQVANLWRVEDGAAFQWLLFAGANNSPQLLGTVAAAEG